MSTETIVKCDFCKERIFNKMLRHESRLGAYDTSTFIHITDRYRSKDLDICEACSIPFIKDLLHRLVEKHGEVTWSEVSSGRNK